MPDTQPCYSLPYCRLRSLLSCCVTSHHPLAHSPFALVYTRYRIDPRPLTVPVTSSPITYSTEGINASYQAAAVLTSFTRDGGRNMSSNYNLAMKFKKAAKRFQAGDFPLFPAGTRGTYPPVWLIDE